MNFTGISCVFYMERNNSQQVFYIFFSICLIYVSKYHYEYLAIFPIIKLLPDRTVILICNVVGKGGACVCLWMCLCAYACEIVRLIESMC